MSDLFGNHIVGFPTRRLKLELYLPQVLDISVNSQLTVKYNFANITLNMIYDQKTYILCKANFDYDTD